MNAIYEYFFPPAPAAEPEPEPPKRVSLCFTYKNEIYHVTLSDVAGMSLSALRHWRPMIIAHSLETYDVDESENADLILREMDKCIQELEALRPS